MELAELINAIRVVEVSAQTRPAAMQALVHAMDLDRDSVGLDDVLKKIEERESTAQTIVDEGCAIPHAIIDWSGDYRVVLGWSRAGVDYGIPGCSRVHLIVLFVVGRGHQKEFHLELLAVLGELLQSSEFRRKLIGAQDTQAIESLLRSRAGLSSKGRVRQTRALPQSNTTLARHAIELAREVEAQAILLAVNDMDCIPWQVMSEWEGRLLIVTAEQDNEMKIGRQDTHVFEIRHAGLNDMDRTNLGLLLAASTELLVEDTSVVCVTGHGEREFDSVNVTRPKTRLRAMFGGRTTRSAAHIRPAVILRALSLAVELAAEGREGRSVGTLFVIGDARHVMRHSQQLVLNPFHGYSRTLRNLLDPSLAETIKEFASIDGAFVVQSDGVVLSAGTYLIPKVPSKKLRGYGTRHQAAAAITAQTQAMAIAVSQSTGTVTVFRNGEVVLTLERAKQFQV